MIATLLRLVLFIRGWDWRKPVLTQFQETPQCHLSGVSRVGVLDSYYGTKTLLQWSLFLGATELHLIGLASMISQIVISYLIHHIYREYFNIPYQIWCVTARAARGRVW